MATQLVTELGIADRITQLIRENTDLRSQLEQLNGDYTKLLNRQDILPRIVANANVSPVFVRLYLALIETYPQLLDGESVEISVWEVRKAAGWPSGDSATRFFKDFQTANAFVYEAGKYNKKDETRLGRLTPNPDIFPYPEVLDTEKSERKRKAREKEEERRKQFRDPRKLLQCPECGSEEILYDVVAHCKCGYVSAPIKNIPASEITIDAEVIEVEDDVFLDEPTVKVPAIPKTPVVVQAELSPAAPASALGKHRHGIACPDCGSMNHWRAIPATGGNTIDVCAICNPDCDTW